MRGPGFLPAYLVIAGFLTVMCPVAAWGGPAGTPEPLAPDLHATAARYFTPEQLDRGSRRASGGRLLYAAGLLIKLALLIALCTPRVSGKMLALASWIGGDSRPRLIRWLYLVLLWFSIEAGMLPYRLVRVAFIRSWGDIYGYGQFLLDWIQGWAFMALVLLPALYGILLLRTLVRWWPLIAWAVGVAASVVIAFAHPYVYDPSFNSFWPVTEVNVLDRADEIKQAAGLVADELLWMDASKRTNRGNAYFVGWGGSRRIVLYDTIARYDIDALASLVAHEIGHWRRDHVVKGLTYGSLGGLAFVIFLATALRVHRRIPIIGHGRDSPHVLDSAFVLLVVWVTMVSSLPIQNAISRKFEVEADHESLVLTKDPVGFIRLEVMLTLQNKGEAVAPPFVEWALHTHPSTARRIAAAETYARQEGIELPTPARIMAPRPPAVPPGGRFPPLPDDFPLIRPEPQL